MAVELFLTCKMMKPIKALLMLACMMGAMASCDTPETIAQWYPRYVEPRIGTAHCRYFHFAPGAMPFGMAKPGPSTNGHLGNKDGWEATGYDYRDGSIEGFPCRSTASTAENSMSRTSPLQMWSREAN